MAKNSHDFPEGDTNSQNGCASSLFGKFFAENYMKIKEFGTGASLEPPWDPPVNSKTKDFVSGDFVKRIMLPGP